ncbi:putative nuclease HARBI1 [Stomoxys calcitrans]|uniref:putative nuclease HARBI1 n=1 Tax=Stomoxys calcitrans TaxID=35570 RepID=UPI0027E2BA6A|nr:putative nuclease HARBI1 [Stomoxys calcitrans]
MRFYLFLILLKFIGKLEQTFKRRRPRVYKERVDPFSIPDHHFKAKYRFKKSTAKKIIGLIKNDIELSKRGHGTPAELQVMIALRCWGCREVQDDAGDLHGLAQPTVSRICNRVSRALARHGMEYINMPTSLEEQAVIMRDFKAIRNFPGVIGAIDGTHVKIKKTGGDLAQYYINRKGFYSLNVQVVCDTQLKIRDIVARWRGSTHDCRIFNESSIKERFEKKEFRGRLLGDSGYQLTHYLFTPLLRTNNEKEERYNVAHIATRNTVERCFGVWKQ